MYKLIAKDGEARRGEVSTEHGTFQTPAFMPVGTYGAVKSISPEILHSINAEIILSNTYHLMERPGVDIIKLNGGLHNFMSWDKPILTDSGGYQVFSLAKKRKITEEGVEFNSALNGNKLFLNPEKCMELQQSYGVDIAMVLDECTPYPAEISVAEKSMQLSLRWAERSRNAFNSNKSSLFGIIQGGVYGDLREQSLEGLKRMDFEGYAIGGLSVGEPKEDLRQITNLIAPKMPADKPRYLMGVGTPLDIIKAVESGVDMFDCVIPTRHARNGYLYGSETIEDQLTGITYYPIHSLHNDNFSRAVYGGTLDPSTLFREGDTLLIRHQQADVRFDEEGWKKYKQEKDTCNYSPSSLTWQDRSAFWTTGSVLSSAQPDKIARPWSWTAVTKETLLRLQLLGYQ